MISSFLWIYFKDCDNKFLRILVSIYQTKWRHITEDSNIHTRNSENPISLQEYYLLVILILVPIILMRPSLAWGNKLEFVIVFRPRSLLKKLHFLKLCI
jgi:hypothetical protein